MVENKIRIIKKYPNRRLYDTTLSCYVKLADLKQLVLDQVNFRVVEAQTNADVTKSTLLQIISENENTVNALFSIEILQYLIRFCGDNMQNLVSNYLEKALEFFIQQKESFSQGPYDPTRLTDNSIAWMNKLFTLQAEFWQSFSTFTPTNKANTPTTDNKIKKSD